MPALETPAADIGWKAPNFSLKATDGDFYSPKDVAMENGLVVMFICNHCPFVQAIAGKLERDMKELAAEGIGCIAVSANDTVQYPEDSFENMKKFAAENNFSFPYVIDETQEIAKAYGTVCTPDFFGFDKDLKLQYRGRLDNSGMKNVPDAKRDLVEAMLQVARIGKVTAKQYNSIGCNIKWRG